VLYVDASTKYGLKGNRIISFLNIIEDVFLSAQ